MDLARKVIMTMYSKGFVDINESPCLAGRVMLRSGRLQCKLD